MIIIEVNNTEIKVTDEKFHYIQERMCMSMNQAVLIRNKHDAKKLSQKTLKSLEESQRTRLQEALKDNDMMYLNSLYSNASFVDLIKLLLSKYKNILNYPKNR